MQIGAEKPAAEPNPEDDEDLEGAFSGPDTEDEKIDLPPRLMDDIASDIFVSGFLWENGLKPVYKVGENDIKIIEIKLKNGETIILKEDEDFCYGYDGTPYFTKDFVEKNGHIALIGNKENIRPSNNTQQNKPAIESGGDAKKALESLGYEVEIYETNTMGRRIFISGNGLKYVIFDGTAGLKTDKEGNIIFTSQWENSAQIKQLLNPEKTLEVKGRFLKFAEKVQAGGEMTLAEIEALYQNYEWVQDIPEVSNALKPLYENDEFVDLLEQCYDNLGLDLYLPETELSAGEMVAYTLYSLITGNIAETSNSNFNTALKLMNFAVLITPAGFARKHITNLVVKKAASKVLPKFINTLGRILNISSDVIINSQAFKTVIKGINALDNAQNIKRDFITFIEGVFELNNSEIPEWLQEVLEYLE